MPLVTYSYVIHWLAPVHSWELRYFAAGEDNPDGIAYSSDISSTNPQAKESQEHVTTVLLIKIRSESSFKSAGHLSVYIYGTLQIRLSVDVRWVNL